MINFGGAKMSKSLGNMMDASDFIDEQSPEIYKYMMLSVHYRSVLDFSDSAIEMGVLPSSVARLIILSSTSV